MVVKKIFIIGAGHIGASSAAVLIRRQFGEVFLYDIKEDFAVGQAMDINQASPSWNSDLNVRGTNTIGDLRGSDIVVITAGAPRHDGMTRLDLLNVNLPIMKKIGADIMAFCPGARVLLVSNPVDLLTWFMKDRWPEMNVFGLGCALDTLRLRYFIADMLGVSVNASSGTVIGTHDNNMLPLVRYATAGGVPVRSLISGEEEKLLIKRTKEAGTAIVHKLKDRSGFYAASGVISQIIESMLFNKCDIFPLDVSCRGEYGYENICLALPAVVDERGVARIIQIALDEEYRGGLDVCATTIRKEIGLISTINP